MTDPAAGPLTPNITHQKPNCGEAARFARPTMPEPRSRKPTKLVSVRFLPDDETILVPPGDTILAAAQQAGVYISSICGGTGICGKCKVIVNEGKVHSKPTPLLEREEIQRNCVLACETTIEGDVEILVPDETRLEAGRILIDEDAHRLGVLPSGVPAGAIVKHDPLVRKVYVEMDPPTTEDNEGDHERLYAAIANQAGIDAATMQTSLRLLKALPTQLRNADWHVTAALAHRGATTELLQIEPGNRTDRNFGIVLDVGTTTVVAHLVDMATSKTIDADATYNSQMQYGEDYITRIMYAVRNNARDEMAQLVVDDINDLIRTLTQRTEVDAREITSVSCAGNTAMIHLLLGLDPSRIRSAPYIPSANVIPPLRAAEVGIEINLRGVLYCLPSVAAYIGSDIAAGAVAIGLHRAKEISLFIDIGTNGEVVLGNREWMVSCSASAGPAFEGSGVRHGMHAARGAIEKLSISGDFEVTYQAIDDRPPRGLCGSGLLDCIAAMLRVGVIDRTGRIQEDAGTNRVRTGSDGLEFVIAWQEATALQTDLVITQVDLENLIRSKAAIYAAMSILVESLGLSVTDVHRVYLAGGFGNYLDIDNAITIGMLPDMARDQIQFVGNTSVTGAKMALLSNEALETMHQVAADMTYFDLMGNPGYMDEFVQAQFLPHTNFEEFPSVVQNLRGAATRAAS